MPLGKVEQSKPQLNTLAKVVETSPVFQKTQVPKIRTVRSKNISKSSKNQQESVDLIKKS